MPPRRPTRRSLRSSAWSSSACRRGSRDDRVQRLSAQLATPAPATLGPLAAIAARPRLAALLGALCIAFSGIFYRFAAESPSTATVFRSAFGLPVLVAIAVAERRRLGALDPRAQRIAAIAGIFFAGDLLFWHHAIEAVGAGLATVLANLQVLVVGIGAWLLLGERPTGRTVVAVPIVLAGVILISGLVGSGAYGSDPLLGVALGLLTALCYGAYLLLIRRSSHDRRRAAGPVAISTAVTLAVAVAVGSLIGDLDLTPDGPGLGWLVLYGVTSQSLGYVLISLSLPRLPAVLTSIILLAQPVATVILAMLLLAEAPSPAQLAGVALVVGGIAAATLPAGRLRARAAWSQPG